MIGRRWGVLVAIGTANVAIGAWSHFWPATVIGVVLCGAYVSQYLRRRGGRS